MDNNKFDWTQFYGEFAQKLLRFKNNRGLLLDWIYSDLVTKKDFALDYFQQKDGSKLTDIDPFSVFAIFNRNIKWIYRRKLLKLFKDRFRLDSDVPQISDCRSTILQSDTQNALDSASDLQNLAKIADVKIKDLKLDDNPNLRWISKLKKSGQNPDFFFLFHHSITTTNDGIVGKGYIFLCNQKKYISQYFFISDNQLYIFKSKLYITPP